MFMSLTATGIFLGTQINFLQPIQIDTDFERSVFPNKVMTEELQVLASDRYRYSSKYNLGSLYVSSRSKNDIVEQAIPGNLSTSIAIEKFARSNNFDPYTFVPQETTFRSGVASWETNSIIGSLKLNGDFNDRAEFTKGKALWNAKSIDLNLSFDNKLKPIEGNAILQTNTALGSWEIKGNFDRDITFTGANAAWKTDTKLGAIAIRGNFDRQTTFTSAEIALSTKTYIGSLTADVKLDDETRFNGGNAAWNTNLLFGSNIGVSGKFNEQSAFTGGSIKLGAKTIVGTLGIKANLDRETNFTGGSAFWKTRTEFGSFNLDANLEKDGNFNSRVGLEIPF